jgi:hypothetical protein
MKRIRAVTVCMGLLNRSQRSSLAVTLSSLEEAVHSIYEVLDNDVEHLFFEYTNGMCSVKATEIARELERMLEVAREMKHKFQIEAEQVDARKRILGEISTIWECLLDSRAERLRRYGKVCPELRSELDPDIDRLVRSAEQIRKLVVK